MLAILPDGGLSSEIISLSDQAQLIPFPTDNLNIISDHFFGSFPAYMIWYNMNIVQTRWQLTSLYFSSLPKRLGTRRVEERGPWLTPRVPPPPPPPPDGTLILAPPSKDRALTRTKSSQQNQRTCGTKTNQEDFSDYLGPLYLDQWPLAMAISGLTLSIVPTENTALVVDKTGLSLLKTKIKNQFSYPQNLCTFHKFMYKYKYANIKTKL